MRDAAGQRSQTLQLLPCECFFLRAPGVGHVLAGAEHSRRRAVLIQQHVGPANHRPHVSTRPENPNLNAAFPALGKTGPYPLLRSSPVLRRDYLRRLLVTWLVILRLAQDSKHLFGTRHPIGLDVPDPIPYMGHALSALQPRFALPQKLGCADLLGNVLICADETHRSALLILDHLGN